MKFSFWSRVCAACLLAALVQQTSGQQAKDLQGDAASSQRHPAPEPYSFSYEAESIGGFSARSESGDAQGRVTGFYTILGEDGRERRVDYVADENGYRAKVSTNEVGTRSESSAEAEYNAQLPSSGQLEQANVTVEQYKYLEAAHANERQRHLSQFNANSAQQFPRQQQFVQQQSNAAAQQQQPQLQQPQQQFQSAQPADGQPQDLDWRTRDLAASSLGQQRAGQLRQVNWNPRNQVRNAAAGQQSAAAAASAAPQIESVTTDKPRSQEGQSATAGETSSSAQQVAAATGETTSSADSAAMPQPNRRDTTQQVHEAAWQLVGRGGVPARKPTTILQRQLEQQFMQQAVQLTDQDYPRQWQSNEQRNTQAINAQRQLPIVATSNNLNQLGNGEAYRQTEFSQQLTGVAKRPAASFLTGSQQDLGQFNQQQSNIIDEIGAVEQTPAIEQQVSQFVVESSQPATAGRQQQQKFIVNQQQQPIQTTTTTTFGTTQATPSGFVAIDLSGQQQLQENNEQQREILPAERPQQQVVVLPQEAPYTQQAKTQQVQLTYENQQQKRVETGAGRQQQLQQQFAGEDSQQLQEVPTRPNSIKQIIDNFRQPEQQSKYVQPTTTTTAIRTTTPVAPRQETTSRIVFAPITTTPVPFVAATTQESLIFSQQPLQTTRQPSVFFTTTEAAPLVELSAETESPAPRPRPDELIQQVDQQQVQQRPQVSGVKGGGSGGGRTSTVGFGSFQAGRIYKPATSTYSQSEEFPRRPIAPPATNVATWTSTGAAQQATTPQQPTTTVLPARVNFNATSWQQANVSTAQRQQAAPYSSAVDQVDLTSGGQFAKQVSSIQRQRVEGNLQQVLREQQLVTRPPKFDSQQDAAQFKGGAVKGGGRSKSSARKFWRQQQPQVLLPSGNNQAQQVSSSLGNGVGYAATNLQVDVSQPSASFGSRVAGR